MSDTRAEFSAAAAAYEAWLTDWTHNVALLREAQASLRAAEFDVETFELELSLEPTIAEGKNAEQRTALLRAACVIDETYLRLSVVSEEARSDVAQHTDAAQAARDRMSLEKRRLDFSIGWLSFLAQEGGESQ